MNAFAFKVIDAINRDGMDNGNWGLVKDVDNTVAYFGTREEIELKGQWAYIYAEKDDTLSLQLEKIEPTRVLPYEESVTAMYIRANTTFELAQEVFGCIDKIEKADSPDGEIAFVTAQLPYGEIIEKIAALESRGAKVISKIRIGDL